MGPQVCRRRLGWSPRKRLGAQKVPVRP